MNSFFNKKLLKKSIPWIIFSILLFSFHWRYELNADEGAVLNAAWNIINGKKLYTDVFEFIAPGAPYLLAAWWKLTNVSYVSAKIFSLLILLSGTIAVYLSGAQFSLRRWKFLAPAAFVIASSFWQPINHNTFNIAAIAWGLYFIIKAIKNPQHYINFTSAGIFFSLSILFLQHKGLAASSIIGLLLLCFSARSIIPLRALAAYLIGLLIPLIPIFLYWPSSVLYQHLIVFPSQHYQAVNALPLLLWMGCTASSLLLFAFVAQSSEVKSRPALSVLLLTGIFLLITSLPRPDGAHILLALTPFFIVLAIFFESFLNQKLELILFTSFWFLCSLLIIIQTPPFSRTAQSVISKIQETCASTATIYAGPFMPNLYFELRTLSTTRFSMLFTDMNTNEQFIEAATNLESNPPHCVIVNYSMVQHFNYNQNNPVDLFIANNYHLSGTYGTVKILSR